MNFKERLASDAALIEARLRDIFAGLAPRGDIYPAMEYSLLAGGKRLRPILTLECCRLCGGDMEAALPLGCAVEMIHTYSLIHDDLPAMDNDDLRRGKPTNHKVFGEATAILAGDGLLTAAFGVVADASALSDRQRLEAVRALSAAAGPQGMVGGQMLDMDGEDRPLSRSELEELQRLKTGALIGCAARLGCIAAQADEQTMQAIEGYAQRLGLAFQVRDDILDVTSTVEDLGKPIGSDAEQGKTTFVTLLGLEDCQRWVEELSSEACACLDGMAGAELLRELAQMLASRET